VEGVQVEVEYGDYNGDELELSFETESEYDLEDLIYFDGDSFILSPSNVTSFNLTMTIAETKTLDLHKVSKTIEV
jgi:hypothetical protein